MYLSPRLQNWNLGRRSRPTVAVFIAIMVVTITVITIAVTASVLFGLPGWHIAVTPAFFLAMLPSSRVSVGVAEVFTMIVAVAIMVAVIPVVIPIPVISVFIPVLVVVFGTVVVVAIFIVVRERGRGQQAQGQDCRRKVNEWFTHERFSSPIFAAYRGRSK